MDEHKSLSHTRWDCKYHVVFIPKCRRKTLYLQLRKYLGDVFRNLAMQNESRIEEWHLMPDHVHMMISIPPKYGYHKSSGTLKVRARYTWLGSTGKEAELRRSAFLGQRIFRLHSRESRGCDPRILQEPGKRGQPPGAAEPMALIGHLQVANQSH